MAKTLNDLKILVVEDNKSVLKIMKAVFRSIGLRAWRAFRPYTEGRMSCGLRTWRTTSASSIAASSPHGCRQVACPDHGVKRAAV